MKSHRIILPAIAVALLAGCQSDKAAQEPFFAPDDQPRLTQAVIETQAARGARADATLYNAHFDGPTLNSLGRAKLSLMVKDNDTALPVVVYVNVTEESAARRDAVVRHLTDAGLTEEQVRTVAGHNPGTLHPAGPSIERLSKTESGEAKHAAAAAEAPAVGVDLTDLSKK